MSLTVFAPVDAPPETRALEQIETCLADPRAVKGALMADHHLGYSMPIGGVIAYDNAVSPSGVGFDIACGNMAVQTNLLYDDVRAQKLRLLAEIQRQVAFGIGRTNEEPIEHPLFDDPRWDEVERIFGTGLKQKAWRQLGTVGSGNHYVDLLVGSGSRLWVANHFGSRGFGHTIASGFLKLAAGLPVDAKLRESEEPTVLSLDSPLGATYHALMQLAGEYAYAGREHVIRQVLGILGAQPTWEVHNHHNYAWEEAGLIVVRKGATPLTREPAFIGGSMADDSVIARGTGKDAGNIGSAPHGAGRVMSRTKAAGKWRNHREERSRPDGSTYTFKRRQRDPSTAAIDWPAVRAELHQRGVDVLGGGADEAPAVYKPLAAVLLAHPNVEILEWLTPVGVVMAGEDEFDPYKD